VDAGKGTVILGGINKARGERQQCRAIPLIEKGIPIFWKGGGRKEFKSRKGGKVKGEKYKSDTCPVVETPSRQIRGKVGVGRRPTGGEKIHSRPHM